ncbi:MAG: hypothetical protein JW976_13945 [Syntrophaceae bacterium]|nr:hypothetical protein [Syntrophaceae bacterium]
MIKDYYHRQFRADLSLFMPDTRVPYFGHSWAYDCGNLNKIQSESRAEFLICLYFTVLVDQAMYTYYKSDYDRFAQLTLYPKFCHGLGQFQKNPRELLLIPVQKGMVDKGRMENKLSEGMELFIDEVVDLFQKYMSHIDPAAFFERLIYDKDVQIPLLIVILPEMKNDIVVEAYEALCAAVEKKIKKKG